MPYRAPSRREPPLTQRHTSAEHATLAQVRELKGELTKDCTDAAAVVVRSSGYKPSGFGESVDRLGSCAYPYMRTDGWEKTHEPLLDRRGCPSNFVMTRGVTRQSEQGGKQGDSKWS